MGRRAETKVGRISIVPVHTRYVVVQGRSAAALGAVGRPSEILVLSESTRPGKGLKLWLWRVVGVAHWSLHTHSLLYLAVPIPRRTPHTLDAHCSHAILGPKREP